jgi:hypothetical protein
VSTILATHPPQPAGLSQSTSPDTWPVGFRARPFGGIMTAIGAQIWKGRQRVLTVSPVPTSG